MGVSELRRLRQLEEENRRLKQLVGHLIERYRVSVPPRQNSCRPDWN